MPHKLRTHSGEGLIRFFCKLGFEIYSTNGSHVKLRREMRGLKETLTIPKHEELAKKTTKEIFKQASRYVSYEILVPFFYTD